MLSLARIAFLSAFLQCKIVSFSFTAPLNRVAYGSPGAQIPKLYLASKEDTIINISSQKLNASQTDFTLGYLNKHHGSFLQKLAEAFSPLGIEMVNANGWSGGSFKILDTKAVAIDTEHIELDVLVFRRGKGNFTENVSFSLDANTVAERRRQYSEVNIVPNDPGRKPIDDIVRKLNRLAWIVGEAKITGKLIQMALQLGGSGIGKLPESMYLNQVPHNRYVRNYFYESAARAVKDAVILCSQGKHTNRMKVISQFPEMNPTMDSYRIGTILEMVRTMAISLAEENLRVRVCVQGSMGVGIFTAVPKQLNGVMRLLQMMDWQSNEGEINEGMVGTYINFGGVGSEHVVDEKRDADGNIIQHQDDVFILVAPQSMVGTDTSIIPFLQSMVHAAGDRPVILVNPDLTDKVSAAGQQNIRGRKERIEFASSFETVFHFQNIYISGTSYFPILGAITKLRPSEPWVAHQRFDYLDGDGEIYVPVLSSENIPTGEAIMESFER